MLTFKIDTISIDFNFDYIENPTCEFHGKGCDCCLGCTRIEDAFIRSIGKVEEAVGMISRYSGWMLGATEAHVVIDDYNWHCTERCISELEKAITKLEKQLEGKPTWEDLENRDALFYRKVSLELLKELLKINPTCEICGVKFWDLDSEHWTGG